MAKRSYHMLIDIKREIFENIRLKPIDTGNVIKVKFTEDGVPYNLTGQEVRFMARKPDGTGIYNAVTVSNASKGYCDVELTNQVLSAEGELKCEFEIEGADGLITTLTFYIYVDHKLNDGIFIESTNEFTALQKVIREVREAVAEMQETAERKLVEIKNNADTKLSQIQSQVDNKIAEADEKIQETNSTIQTANSSVVAMEKKVNDLVADVDNRYVKTTGGNVSGNITFTNGSPIVRSSDNADVRLDFANDTQARIRVGGNGAGTSNGFEIQGQGDRKLLRVDSTGQLFAGGVNQVYHERFKQNVLPQYTARPATADIAIVGDGGMRLVKATTAMTTNKPMSDGHILNFDWDTTAGYNSQLFLANNHNPKIQMRGQRAGVWGEWHTVYSTNNKPTPADIGALPLTGGTMTGVANSPSFSATGYRTASTNATPNQWFKVATLTITKQYSDVTACIDYVNHGSADGSLISGRIKVMLKQQDALGKAPVYTLYITDAIRPTAVEVRLIVTATTTTKTEAQVWMKIGITYTGITYSMPFCSVSSTATIALNNNPVFATLPSGTTKVAVCYRDNIHKVRQVKTTTHTGTFGRVTISPQRTDYTNYKVTVYCQNKREYSNINVLVNGTKITHWTLGSTFSMVIDCTRISASGFFIDSTVKCQFRKDSGAGSPESYVGTISASTLDNIVLESASGSSHGMDNVVIVEEWC